MEIDKTINISEYLKDSITMQRHNMATISEICWNLVYSHWTPCLLNITVILEWKEGGFWQRN